MPRSVLPAFGIDEELVRVNPYGPGLINKTWKVELPGRSYILQRINENVFSDPYIIASNIRKVANHFQTYNPDYFFVAPIPAKSMDEIYKENGHSYRLFPFVDGSHTVETVSHSSIAFEAAQAFGKFTMMLKDFDVQTLQITIPGFHDLEQRAAEYENSLVQGNRRKVLDCEELVKAIAQCSDIRDRYHSAINNPGFLKRVIHHDTKISNVLFDLNSKAICIIDLDTIMPGLFLSDLGDMFRSYLSLSDENEKDAEKIKVRPEIFEAIVLGYLGQMNNELTAEEKKYIYFSGEMMLYMQCLRFLTDYFYDNRYYIVNDPEQNFWRATNQFLLLKEYRRNRAILEKFIPFPQC